LSLGISRVKATALCGGISALKLSETIVGNIGSPTAETADIVIILSQIRLSLENTSANMCYTHRHSSLSINNEVSFATGTGKKILKA
jgi:hypothetical protein